MGVFFRRVCYDRIGKLIDYFLIYYETWGKRCGWSAMKMKYYFEKLRVSR